MAEENKQLIALQELVDDYSLVGIHGAAGSGKDTAAKVLVENHRFHRLAFADPLKEAVKAIFGFTDDDVHTPEGKAKYSEIWETTHRDILQRFGTEACRDGLREDIWVKALEVRLRSNLAQGFINNVIADVRFPNEAQAVKDWGGLLVKIERPADSALSSEEQQHASELGLADWKDWDWVIHNDGTLHDLKIVMSRFNYVRLEPVTGEVWADGLRWRTAEQAVLAYIAMLQGPRAEFSEAVWTQAAADLYNELREQPHISKAVLDQLIKEELGIDPAILQKTTEDKS